MLKETNFTKTGNWIIANLIDFIGFGILNCRNLLVKVNKNNSYSDIKKILIIRTDSIGDILVTIPLIKVLKENLYGEAKLDLLVTGRFKDIIKDNPYVDEVIEKWTRWQDSFEVFAYLKKKKYDLIISPRIDGYFPNHLLATLIGSKRRVGYAMKGGGFLLTDIIPWNGEKNMVQLLLDIPKMLSKDAKMLEQNIEISVNNEDEIYAENLLRDNGISNNNLIIGLNPFAGHPFIWTADGFIKITEKLVEEYNANIVFIGEEKSKEKIDEIRKFISVSTVSLAGKTNLRQLSALIKKFSLLITVDSGPRHTANGVNTPVIVLRNGANSNVLWGKYSENEHLIYHQVPCSPCGKKFCPEPNRICMTKIDPEEVLNCVEKVI